ncbi:ribosome biogenesis GTP-binding protein YihA/YsxC [Candidatus Methylocalor cossyra]|uniref:Probable GTP-binding protein EngB n=1 Tax=Candidatus Methylocalor cossyra TaxID=3108543 RepID=A0ABM9NLN7_9GAMM
MHTLYRHCRFLLSTTQLQNAPPDRGFEVAFAGRSNAGKSSAINLITGQKNLARVSKTPGRTQALNFFGLDDQRRLVDLPGYGYAEVPSQVQQAWRHLLETYLSGRECLRGVFLVMDIRHPLTGFDRLMIDWCRHFHLPVHIALTKADKLSRGAALATERKLGQELARLYGDDLGVQLLSVPQRTGVAQAQARLNRWLELR